MLSVGAIRFEDRFYPSKKGRIGGGGWVSARGAVHIAAALAGYKTVLVALAEPFLSFLAQAGIEKATLPL